MNAPQLVHDGIPLAPQCGARYQRSRAYITHSSRTGRWRVRYTPQRTYWRWLLGSHSSANVAASSRYSNRRRSFWRRASTQSSRSDGVTSCRRGRMSSLARRVLFVEVFRLHVLTDSVLRHHPVTPHHTLPVGIDLLDSSPTTHTAVCSPLRSLSFWRRAICFGRAVPSGECWAGPMHTRHGSVRRNDRQYEGG